jgi:ABC-type antimicrobial peptide transport system permease subunit
LATTTLQRARARQAVAQEIFDALLSPPALTMSIALISAFDRVSHLRASLAAAAANSPRFAGVRSAIRKPPIWFGGVAVEQNPERFRPSGQ